MRPSARIHRICRDLMGHSQIKSELIRSHYNWKPYLRSGHREKALVVSASSNMKQPVD